MKPLFLTLLVLFLRVANLCEANEKPFITGSLLGQMGNMMFQVATTSALAWDHGADAYFPDLFITPILYQHIFSRCKVTPPSNEISHAVCEPSPLVFANKIRLNGYFQEERYFAHHRAKLVKLFAPISRDLKYIQKKYGWIVDHPNSVGVQLRFYRREVVDGFPQYGKRYLEKAMAQFPEDSLFVVCSDNIEFARSCVPAWVKHVVFMENEPSYIDFYLLTLCKHNITSNSSFGWWSAWLNENPHKKVVCPDFWIDCTNEHIYPKDWIRIQAEFEDL